jgi:hypothetical protein
MKQTTLYDNWNNGLKMIFSLGIVLALLSLASAADENPIPSQNAPAESDQHVMAKRAWNQLQGSWGKRNVADDNSLEELQRKLIKMYAEQLLTNNVDLVDEEEYEDGPVEKRAWNSMNSAWGKRDWTQVSFCF